MRLMKLAVLTALCWLLWAEAAAAQSNPGLVYGQVPSAAQWNSYFSAKQDVLLYTPVNKAGDSMLGKLVTTAATTGGAGFSVTPGSTPSAPQNGDIWITASGFFAQVNGGTVSVSGLLGAAGNLAWFPTLNSAAGNPNANMSAGTGTLTLGVNGSTSGALALSGSSTGTATIAVQAAAGTPTLTLGTSSGTPAVTASSPLAITTATGNITCSTCAVTGTPQTFTAAQTINITGIGTAATDGLILENTTAAGAGAQQYSPRLHYIAQGWKTNATAASQTVDWAVQEVPVQGSSNPSANLVISSQINGGGYSTRATFTSGGFFGLGTEGNPQYGLVFSKNATTGLALGSVAATGLIAEVDATSARMLLSSWGASTLGYDGIAAGGTAASPTATTSGIQLNALGGRGYANGAYPTASAALISEIALNSWTASDTSSYITFNTTPSGSTTRALAVQIQASGGVSIGSTTDPGIGSLFANAAGAAATPSISFGNVTTGLYSVSTTGLGLTVNGTVRLDYGITTASTWTMSGNFNAPGIASLSANTTAYVCWTTSTGAISRDSVTCLSSLRKLKKGIKPLDGAMVEIMELHPRTFEWRDPMDQNQRGEQVGFVAEEVDGVDPRLASHSSDGGLHGWREEAMVTLLTRGIQELKADNDNLRAELSRIKKLVHIR